MKIILMLIGGLLLAGCTIPTDGTPTTGTDAAQSAGSSVDTSIGGTLTIATAAGLGSFRLDELREALPTDTFTIYDPLYERTKTYEGFWLADLLAYTHVLDEPGDVILFRAADGYESRLDVANLDQAQPKGFVAFRDVEAADGWEPVLKGKSAISPAPFYLVWGFTDEDAAADAETLSARNLPWPYQLIHIEMIDFATTYDRLYPGDDVDPKSAIYSGLSSFRTKLRPVSFCQFARWQRGAGVEHSPEHHRIS